MVEVTVAPRDAALSSCSLSYSTTLHIAHRRNSSAGAPTIVWPRCVFSVLISALALLVYTYTHSIQSPAGLQSVHHTSKSQWHPPQSTSPPWNIQTFTTFLLNHSSLKPFWRNLPNTRQTPCPLSLPLSHPFIPISPADWGPLSNPEKPAEATQTGSPVAGAWVGVY